METCEICNKTFNSSKILGEHKNTVHSNSITLKIHQPYVEMSNEEIAARYLNRQKGKLDEDMHKKLKLKLKGLNRFRPKSYDRKSLQISDDESNNESPIGPMKPSIPKPPTLKRKRNGDDKDKPSSKTRRIAKKSFQCSACPEKFENRSDLSLHMGHHPKCPY